MNTINVIAPYRHLGMWGPAASAVPDAALSSPAILV